MLLRLFRLHGMRYDPASMIGRALASVAVLLALCDFASAAWENGRCREYPEVSVRGWEHACDAQRRIATAVDQVLAALTSRVARR